MFSNQLSSDQLSNINSILNNHDIETIEKLPIEIETRKQEIVKLEALGKTSTADKRKKSLAELEELQKLVDQIKKEEINASSGSSSSVVITQEILDQLSSHDIAKIEDLPLEIENRKQQIKELEVHGKKSTAAKRKKSLEELENLQKLVYKNEVISSIITKDKVLDKSSTEEQYLEINSKQEVYSVPGNLEVLIEAVKDLETFRKTTDVLKAQEDISCHELVNSQGICVKEEIQQSGSKCDPTV